MDVRPVDEARTPRLYEIRGPMNTPVGNEVMAAAQSWIAAHASMLRRELGFLSTPQAEERFHELIWQPFASAFESATGRRLPTPSLAGLIRDTRGICMWEK
jgi:hypothetical protein